MVFEKRKRHALPVLFRGEEAQGLAAKRLERRRGAQGAGTGRRGRAAWQERQEGSAGPPDWL